MPEGRQGCAFSTDKVFSSVEKKGIKLKMNNKVSMRKRGKFYTSYDDDAYVLYALLGYKIVKNRVGFPTETLGKVTNILEENHVNYTVIEDDREVLKKKFSNNHYEKVLDKGKCSFDKSNEEKRLEEAIKGLDEEKVNLILDFIKEVVYSG